MAPSRVLFLALLCGCSSTAPREDLEPFFRALESGSPAQALEAGERLAALYDDSALPRLTKALETAPARSLQLIGDLTTDGSAMLLLDRLPRLLGSEDEDVVRMAMVGAGLRRVREASPLLLERAEEPVALRALGRIRAQPLDAPALPRKDEIQRLATLAIAHRWTMRGTPQSWACETMFAVMTRDELANFLGKHGSQKFPARRLCDQAARRGGFDAGKGLLIHEALLSSPDLELVADILESSPFPLREELVRGFLKDDRLRDVAAKRLKR